MILRQTLEYPIDGYWNGGKKQVFDWRVAHNFSDARSRISCWTANHYFEVATGNTEKLTLSYAKQHLKAATCIAATFEYIEE